MTWKTFKEYCEWRLNENHKMSHKEALQWVLSALGIMDNADPDDPAQQDEINGVLAAPLSNYPKKLDDLKNQPKLTQSPNWTDIEAKLADPKNTTVSELVGMIAIPDQENKQSDIPTL